MSNDQITANEQPVVNNDNTVIAGASPVSRKGNKDKNATAVTTKKPVMKPVPMIGLYNKTGYNVHVVFKDCDIVIPPKGRTTKKYLQSNIVSVQDASLQQALANGIITILR